MRVLDLCLGPDDEYRAWTMTPSPLLAAASCVLCASLEAGAAVRPWQPPGISTSQFESHAAFDPWTGDLYFVRSSPAFEGWRILVSRCTASGWSEPQPPAFAGDGVESDPCFTADGRSLFFISTRSFGGKRATNLDIWRVDRATGSGWGVPERLPEPVNSTAAEWFPRPAPDGGLYESLRAGTGWSSRRKLGPDVNVNGAEIGALFSPSGRSILFSRDTRGPDSGEFFVWPEEGAEAWPPECPRGRR
jgi:hypothetical protein